MPLYSFGSNGNSQLSLSHTTDVSTPTLCKFHTPPPTTPPQSIHSGGNHTFLLLPTGAAYSVGLNSSGQCGFPPSTKTLGTFRLLPNAPSPERVPGPPPESTQWGFITALWESTILATKDGKKVYSCGAGAKGELGLGPSIKSTAGDTLNSSIPGTTLHQIPNFPPLGTYITFLTSSITHVIAVLNDGTCFGWGASRKGQLHPLDTSLSIPKNIPTPIAIPTPFPVARAVCPQDSTLLIAPTGSHRAYLGPTTTKWGIYENLPHDCLGYIDIQSSWNGIYILLSTGEILAWGRGDKGQLPPPDLTRAKMMAVGSEHVIAVVQAANDDREKLVAWGWGEHGNCGKVEEGKGDVVMRREVEIPGGGGKRGRIKCVGAGCATSWVWMDWE